VHGRRHIEDDHVFSIVAHRDNAVFRAHGAGPGIDQGTHFGFAGNVRGEGEGKMIRSIIVYTVHYNSKENGRCPHGEEMTGAKRSSSIRRTARIASSTDSADAGGTAVPAVPEDAAVATPPAIPTPRSTYRHGDLRRALLDAGIELARDGGPDAVVLREATRRAGVVPNAAYRHFASRQDLLQAVRSAALAALAQAIEAELAALDESAPPADFARASLRAVGTGYMQFALAEPGLFRTAFSVPDELEGVPIPDKAGDSGLNPYQLLGAALDRMMEAGVLSTAHRPGAEYLAWSAVHGLSMLVIDGPLRMVAMSPGQAHQIGQRLLDMVENGLQAADER